MNDSILDAVFSKTPEPPTTTAAAVDAIVAAQKAAGDPIDPNGARKLLRALTAIGLFKPA